MTATVALKSAVFLVVAGTHLLFQRSLHADPFRKTVMLWIIGDRIMRTLPKQTFSFSITLIF